MSDVHAERAPEALMDYSWTPRTRGARSARTSSKQKGARVGGGVSVRSQENLSFVLCIH
jgi:hypothetical protein